ncbi:MAG: FAD-binding protein [Sulfolobaceae archaeon]|nr:FAD-binding protein [Sulfolobales archaeon]
MEPASIDEVPLLLEEVRRSGDKVVVRGFGKHSPDVRGVKKLYMRKLQGYEISGEELVAQAGASVTKAQEEALSLGYMIPTTYDGTAGGLVASDMPSPLSTAFGNPSDWITELKVAFPGKVVSWKALAGTFGKLGAVLEVRLKLFPRPKGVYTHSKTYDNIALEEVEKALKMRPLATLVEYEGSWRVYVTYDRKLDLEGFSVDEGAVGLTYQPSKRTFIARPNGFTEFVELVKRVEPRLAVYVHGGSYAFFEDPKNEEPLTKWGNLSTGKSLVKRLLDPTGIFF